jgi:protein-S-isoprenylcysteine O-methyltransferase Ste14
MQIYISGVLYALLIILIASRTLLMHKKGIRAIVFSRTDRSGFLLLSVVLFLAFTVSARVTGLPIPFPLVRPLWDTAVSGWIGLPLCVIALVGIVIGLMSFKDSFRVGIDDKKPDALITTGLFAFSRNPMYVCFLFFFIGTLLMHGNILITLGVIIFPYAIHRQIQSEEVFLKMHYGGDYEEYCKKVRRYL